MLRAAGADRDLAPFTSQALGGLLSQAAAAPSYHGDFSFYSQVHGHLLTIDRLSPSQAKAIIAAIGLRRTAWEYVRGIRLASTAMGYS